MDPVVARIVLVLIVGTIVGGATYVALTIMEILKKRTDERINTLTKRKK